MNGYRSTMEWRDAKYTLNGRYHVGGYQIENIPIVILIFGDESELRFRRRYIKKIDNTTKGVIDKWEGKIL